MPWVDNSLSLNSFIKQAKKLIFNEFNKTIDTAFFVCTREELIPEVLAELKDLKYPEVEIEYSKQFLLPDILGKFFALTNQIWLVDGAGTNFETILHEALHTIQACTGKREPIIDYITYKYTKNEAYIDGTEIIEWQEIEKTNSWKRIKTRLVTEGDCEDF